MIEERTGFIYIWYDRKRKMYYIGCHAGKEDDGYICSSKWMRDAYRYRKQDFKRRIIKRNILIDDLLTEEYKWLSLILDNELGKKYYNLNKHHFGHWHIDIESRKTVKQKLSEASKLLHQDPEYKKKFLEGRKKMPPQTQQQIEKRAKSNTGKKRTEETKRKISESNKGKVMGPLSDEHRQKVSESLKGEKNPFYGKQHDPELKKQMNAKTSVTMTGMIFWNNSAINKRSRECPGEGWVKGTIKN